MPHRARVTRVARAARTCLDLLPLAKRNSKLAEVLKVVVLEAEQSSRVQVFRAHLVNHLGLQA